jgi:hypothetical protein
MGDVGELGFGEGTCWGFQQVEMSGGEFPYLHALGALIKAMTIYMWPLGGVECHMTLLWLLVGPLLGETWAIYIKGSPTSPLANTSVGEASLTLQLIQ